ELSPIGVRLSRCARRIGARGPETVFATALTRRGDTMDRREMLGILGAGAASLTALSAHADDKRADACCQLDKTQEDCLKACSDCAKGGEMAFHRCVMQVAEGKKEHARALQLAADCAGFCGLSACNIAKHSPLMIHSCEACADACKATAAEVGKFDSAQ